MNLKKKKHKKLVMSISEDTIALGWFSTLIVSCALCAVE